MNAWNEARELREAIASVCKEEIQNGTKDCFRVYRATVVKAPYLNAQDSSVCDVQLFGDDNVLSLPYTKATQNMSVGDSVLVATFSNSFRTAIVWDYRSFDNDYAVQTPIKHYGARWNKTLAQMDRMYDAASITTDTQNFGHFGTVNPNYENPFDNIYPWSGIKLCNIDLDAYLALQSGDSVTNCVKAWEGDPDFSYDDENGVWRYRPEFYGASWDDGDYRYFDVCDNPITGYVYYPEAILGRWHGRVVSKNINGTTKNCLIPSVGMPARRMSMSTCHTYANNYGATLDSIFSIDPDVLLCIVEFATMNTQDAIGQGVSAMNRQNSYVLLEDVSDQTVVSVSASEGRSYCIPNAIFEIGVTDGGNQIGSYYVVSAQIDPSDATKMLVTLNQSVTATTANYWSVHGIINVSDEGVGSKSGYIGTLSKCNSYYRGLVLFGNMFLYTLGAYENKADQHIWIANNDEEADLYDALDVNVHYDTGLVMPTSATYINQIALLSPNNMSLSIPLFCTSVGNGATSQNPIGDTFYGNNNTSNTVCSRGGNGVNGSNNGAFSQNWYSAASAASVWLSARPRLKNP